MLMASLFLRGTVLAQATSMPTPDRLAKPTMPASPSQADKGAEVYWLSCLPCHGDVGQGLTDEFRETYPPEEQYCWESGCHGNKPYDSGFTIPKTIPAVIGSGTLQKFPNAFVLRAYIKAAMPFWNPGMLTDEESWQVTSFILRQNGIITNGTELNEANASQIIVGFSTATPTPQPAIIDFDNGSSPWVIPAVALVIFASLIVLYHKLEKNTIAP